MKVKEESLFFLETCILHVRTLARVSIQNCSPLNPEDGVASTRPMRCTNMSPQLLYKTEDQEGQRNVSTKARANLQSTVHK